MTQKLLISKLNSKIRGWMNYHHCANGIWEYGDSMNKYLYERLIKWGLRRHGNKTKKWVFNKYWKHINGRWTFTRHESDDKIYKLINYDLRQKRIRSRISSTTNVFDLKNKVKIRQVQLAKSNDLPYNKDLVWKKQRAYALDAINIMDPIQSQHFRLTSVVPRKDGGSDKLRI